MVWHWPQIVVAVLMFLTFAMHLMKHGESRGAYNAGADLINEAALALLLYFGGFWTGGQ